MVQKQAKRSDQEWMNLIQECRISGLSDKDWCEQHGIPVSSFYNKISKLRKKACDIPLLQNHTSREPQQVIPLEIVEASSLRCNTQADIRHSSFEPAVVLSICGYRMEVANHAAKETIINTLSALQQLC